MFTTSSLSAGVNVRNRARTRETGASGSAGAGLLGSEAAILITIYEERIIVFYGRAIPAICVTQNATQLESQKGASKHSH